jgi:hypothetical protein
MIIRDWRSKAVQEAIGDTISKLGCVGCLAAAIRRVPTGGMSRKSRSTICDRRGLESEER